MPSPTDNPSRSSAAAVPGTALSPEKRFQPPAVQEAEKDNDICKMYVPWMIGQEEGLQYRGQGISGPGHGIGERAQGEERLEEGREAHGEGMADGQATLSLSYRGKTLHLPAKGVLTKTQLDHAWNALKPHQRMTLLGMAIELKPDGACLITINIHSQHVEAALAEGLNLREWIDRRLRLVKQDFKRAHGYGIDFNLVMEVNVVRQRGMTAIDLLEAPAREDRPVDLHGIIRFRQVSHARTFLKSIRKHLGDAIGFSEYRKSKPTKIMAADSERGGFIGWLCVYILKRYGFPALNRFIGDRSPVLRTKGMTTEAREQFDALVREYGLAGALTLLDQVLLERRLAQSDARLRRKALPQLERPAGSQDAPEVGESLVAAVHRSLGHEPLHVDRSRCPDVLSAEAGETERWQNLTAADS